MNSFIIFTYYCLSAKSTPHMLLLKEDYTLCFSDFSITGWCISYANC